MRYPNGRILVFAKAPVPGYAKTRLIPVLGEQGAAHLQAKLIRKTLCTAVESRLAPVQLWTCGDADQDYFEEFRPIIDNALYEQRGDDLGARMRHALAEALCAAEFAVLIGTDCPAMDKDYLGRACAALAESNHDAVLGPAEDGGYVLIGLRRCDSRPFENIAWGTPVVLDETRRRLDDLGWSRQELTVQWDVDDAQDLKRLSAWDAAFA